MKIGKKRKRGKGKHIVRAIPIDPGIPVQIPERMDVEISLGVGHDRRPTRTSNQ